MSNLRKLILEELDIMKDRDGFSPELMRWQRCFVHNELPYKGMLTSDKKKGIHLSKVDYHSFNDESLFYLYRTVYARYLMQM